MPESSASPLANLFDASLTNTGQKKRKIEKECRHCHQIFYAWRSSIKFCSATCRDCSWAVAHRAEKAERAREYGQRVHGYKPRPTTEIACGACAKSFLPKKINQRCCSVRCGQRLLYKENPEKYRAKTKRTQQKTLSAYRARGRMTWTKMRDLRGKTDLWAKAKFPWLSIFYAARHRAKKDGFAFEIDREWCQARWSGYCEVTGIEFILNAPKREAYSPSIDKLDPKLGYTKENSRFVLWAINMFKSDSSTDAHMLRIAFALLWQKGFTLTAPGSTVPMRRE